MKKEQKKAKDKRHRSRNNFSYWVGVAVVASVVGLSAQSFVSAFVEPTQAPPGGNVAGPINVGNVSQWKEGNLAINTTGDFANGLIVPNGKVIVGALDPVPHPTDPDHGIFQVITPSSRTGGMVISGDESSQLGYGRANLQFHDGSTDTRWNMYTIGNADTKGRDGSLMINLAWSNGQRVGSNAIIIRPNRNVGIGTENPSDKLTVDGRVRASGFSYWSDARLKKDIAGLEHSLEKILQMRGVRYSWKDTEKGNDRNIGLVAQEVEEVFPEVVSEDNEGMKSIEYGSLVAPLIEAVKEQQRQIDELKAEVERLKN